MKRLSVRQPYVRGAEGPAFALAACACTEGIAKARILTGNIERAAALADEAGARAFAFIGTDEKITMRKENVSGNRSQTGKKNGTVP